ncbi:MAG: 50S ribosomal protein L11 methyltransferase [Acidobacteriota bacterium]|nr:50S ribosomal protein L11 methyltransferase [Acidobacteriota bacterium]
MESGRSPDEPAASRGRTRWPGLWYELSVVVDAAAEDVVIGLLCGPRALGASSRPEGPGRIRVTSWYDERADARAAARRVSMLEPPPRAEAEIAEIRDPGWLDASLGRREPVRAGRFVVIDAAEPPDRARRAGKEIPIAIPAGRAFGTGEHETTALCLELLDRHLGPRTGEVLDLGTGSGILAIAAALAGVPRVLALDRDPDVIGVAEENVAINGVGTRVEVAVGSWGDLDRGAAYGLIVANIHRTALVRAAKALLGALRPGGFAILSGFATGDAEIVGRAWRRAGADVVETIVRGEWSALTCRRVADPGDRSLCPDRS